MADCYAARVPVVVLLLLLVLVVCVVVASISLLPLTLVQRYRVGIARRPARGWLAAVNLVSIVLSAGLFVIASAVTSVWVPHAFAYTSAGFALGGLLGLLGLALTRWEPTPEALYYTPNRWLVLGILLVVSVRLLYGFWRSWQAWDAGLDASAWAAASGVAGSMAAGATVLGYYLIYWLGVRRRVKRRRSEGRGPAA